MRLLLRFVSVLTTAAGLALMSILMGSHTAFLVGNASASLLERTTGHWQLVYILGADCACSGRVAEHLADRKGLPGIQEQIVVVGKPDRAVERLQQLGWRVVRSSGEEARRLYGARNSPLVVFIDPGGLIRYAGGLARRSDFRDGFQEARIWEELQSGREVQPLPAYGCALTSDGTVNGLGVTAR